jgi:hypothetical protein
LALVHRIATGVVKAFTMALGGGFKLLAGSTVPAGNSEKVIAGADGVNGLTLTSLAAAVRGKLNAKATSTGTRNKA